MHNTKPTISRNQGGEHTITKIKQQHRISTKAIFALLFYLIVPLIAISIILTSYPELSKQRFINMIYWIIPMSIIIIIISQISTKYEKGQNKKYILNILYVIATLLWIYGFLGGNIIITQQWLEYEFSLHLWKYIILIITAAALNIIYYTLEWRYYKEQKTKKENNNSFINKITPETT